MARIKPQALLIQSKKKKALTRFGITKIITCNLIVILIMLSLYATYKHLHRRSREQLGDGLHEFEMETFGQSKKSDRPNYAILNTSKGMIIVELFKAAAPEVVDKFLDLCRKGYFKGMLFHRVIKNFVIQGGDTQSLGEAEDWTLKGRAHGQLAISPKHEAFMLGTTKPKPDSKGFELFITTAPIPDLNDKLTVFGRVIKGEEVVQEIEEVDTDEHYQPKSPIVINNIILKQQV